MPIRLDNCRVPDRLVPIHYVDLFPDYAAGLQKLFSGITFQQELLEKVRSGQLEKESEENNAVSILLVNDEPSIMNILVDHLKSHGLSVDYAFNVPQAINHIYTEIPEVIISDLSHFSFGRQVTDRAAFEILEWGAKSGQALEIIKIYG